jgi:hypothetical protein
MIAADRIKAYILDLAKSRGDKFFTTEEVARNLDPEQWELIMEPVNLVAEVLVMQGLLEKRGANLKLASSQRV